jgi:hypothetical protein
MNRKYASFTALICVLATPARALTIPAFRSHPMNEQHLYALGAVNMLAFTRGLEDEGGNPVDRINDWYRTIGEVQLFCFTRRVAFRLAFQPVAELVRVEADRLADAQVRDAAALDQLIDMPLRYLQEIRDLYDGHSGPSPTHSIGDIVVPLRFAEDPA